MQQDRTTSRGGELLVRLDRASTVPMAQQLERALRELIVTGTLAEGDALPSTRRFAAELGVSRGVVVEAYDQLAAAAWTSGRHGSGTSVLARSDQRAARSPRPTVAAEPPLRCNFRPGVPDLSAFPRASWLRATKRALASLTDADLGYLDPRGLPALRAQLARYLARVRGVDVSAGDPLVVNGYAQGLVVLARVLHARGVTAVAHESPGSPEQRELLTAHGLSVTSAPVDDEGVVVDTLPASGVGAVVVTPAHQYPTGVVLSAARRRALVDWARRADAFVIEDDYDAEYRFGRAPVTAVQPHAPDRVVYAGTVSKSLAPGLRMGWLVPPAELAAECVQAKSAIDLSTPVIEQAVLAELLAAGDFDRHLRRTRLRYEVRRAALLDALASTTALEMLGQAAGLHATFALRGRRSERELIVAARQRGVGLRGLSEHHADRRGRRGLVLGYANLTPDTIRWGASMLVELLG